MFSTLWQSVPVTALHINDEYLYTGQGGTLSVYKICKGKPKYLEKRNVFNHAVIHGIKSFSLEEKQYIVLFGGKEMAILTIQDFYLVCHYKSKDWIWDVQPITKSTTLAIALAHNSCILFDWKKNEEICAFHCSIKCILYSAHFIGWNWEDLVLCAGTVFNQVVAWMPGKNKDVEQKIPLMLIPGHDGVIFDMHYNNQLQILLTASDDRSIRVWKCSMSNGNEQQAKCACVMYGHEARIWKVETLIVDGLVYVISISEDGLCITWLLSMNKEDIQFKVVKKLNLHSNLLSYASDGKDRFAVGCNNGAIYWYSLSEITSSNQCLEAAPFSKDQHGTPKIIKLLSLKAPSVLLYTDKGYVLCYDILLAKWKVVHHLSDYGSYAVMSVAPDGTLIAVGNTKGNVTILYLEKELNTTTLAKLESFSGKIQNISWYQKEMFVSGPSGQLNWYHVDTDVILVSKFVLPQAKHRWHMDALIVNSESQDHVICGDRRGSIHLFVNGQSVPVCTIHGVHGKHGVTSLDKHGNIIISTGRDGYWRQFCVNTSKIEMLTQHRAAQGMEWLENIKLENFRLYVYGFRGNKFVVWSKFSGNEMFSVTCGGCHRSWDFSTELSKFVFLKASQLNIVEVPENVFEESLVEVGFHNHQINCVRFLASYAHDDCHVDIIATASEDTKVIITKLLHNKDVCKAEVLHVIDDHCSNVRSIRVLTSSETDITKEILMVTVGGRATINVYNIQIQKLASNKVPCLVKHVATYKSGASPDMRFMDVAAWKSDNDGHMVAVACSDGKMRWFRLNDNTITLLSESRDTGHCYLVTSRINDHTLAAGTDGFVRIMTSEGSEVSRFRTNQSGVNAIAFCHMTFQGARHGCLATGGDDNSIRLTMLKFERGAVEEVSHCTVEDAHATQVTGLHLAESEFGAQLVSTSIDQRVTLWRISTFEDDDKTSLRCQHLGSKFTHIADVSCIDVIRDRYVISGRGFQVMT
uniref:tRNA (34-2'-O)-methyltransferase regulator WDR6 n=1 Tax=Phallusia mammillata TaxID=59560 RepID=A0A6F9DX24_9ASCI|nr:WD repeat-containing protein 6-like [Phallusia mammillata]